MRAEDAYTGHREADELLFRWRRVIANAEGWTRDFALSIQRARKRPGWVPSPKQLSVMHRLVAELPPPGREDDPDLIEQ